MRTLVAILLSSMLVATLFPTKVAAEEQRLFPATAKTVSGEFLRFYDAKGGEAIFGQPLTDEVVENGRTVQYFSRARFEYWPENPPGQQVQLGLLGVVMGKVQPAVTASVPAGDPERRYFAETGHVVAFAFKTFWETRGGLAVFGYPTTEQLVENGIVVQYFQRARMEWHPENPPGEQVVLGDLGAEYLGQSQGVTATPTATQTVDQGRLIFHTSPGGEIYTVRPDGSELRLVASGMDPAWSPDGQKIAFAGWYPPGIYVAGADGSDAYRISFGTYPWEVSKPQAVSWSPDGRYIAFHEEYQDWRPAKGPGGGASSGRMELVDLWRVDVVDVSTGQVHIVTQDDYGVSPAWGPDGRLVFESTQGLFILSGIDGNHEITKVPNTDTRFASPSWSPDGQWLAFQWRQHDHWEIGVMRIDGTGFRLLTSSQFATTAAENVAPVWSPDGKQIAFVSNRDGEWEPFAKWGLYVMNADGSDQRAVDLGGVQLRYDGVNERPVSWGR